MSRRPIFHSVLAFSIAGIVSATGLAGCGPAESPATDSSAPDIGADVNGPCDACQRSPVCDAGDCFGDGHNADVGHDAPEQVNLDTKDEFVPGQLGDACQSAADCDSGLCVSLEHGKICTTKCETESCPAGYSCGKEYPGHLRKPSVCLPCGGSCKGKQCGYDGCGGSCGKCGESQECADGHCVPCEPKCGNKECGSDGCGDKCGECDVCGEQCVQGICTFTACIGKECGEDGCGGTCGECPPSGACEPKCGPKHELSASFGHSDHESARAVAIGPDGAILVAGSYSSSGVDFGKGPLAFYGPYDIFIAKLSETGDLIWASGYGGPEHDTVGGVAVDAEGAVYFTGSSFLAGADFGGGPLASFGDYDMFVVKLDKDGNHVWSKSFGGESLDRGSDISVGDDVVLVGRTKSKMIDFGGGPIGEPLGGAKVQKSVVVKLDVDGDHVWSHSFRMDSGGFERANSVSVSQSGDVHFFGRFGGSDPIDLGGGPIFSAGSHDIVVAKFDSAGQHIWSKGFGGEGHETSRDIAVDPAGRVFLTGAFSSDEPLDFGGGPLPYNGKADAFVVGLDSSGNHLWSTAFGSIWDVEGRSLAVDDGGYVYVVGTYEHEPVDFGSGPVLNMGKEDIFLMQMSGQGEKIWAVGFGGIHPEYGNALAVRDPDEVVMVGSFESSGLDLGGGSLGDPFQARDDVLVASFSAACDLTFCSCLPDCTEKECGYDGCWGECGECACGNICDDAVCVFIGCDGKECGDDGCDGSCGVCTPGFNCQGGICTPCTPECVGKDCGSDNCGGICGICGAGQGCLINSCVPLAGAFWVDAANADDPLEDGSKEHPFDALSEALAVVVEGAMVYVLPGSYSGANVIDAPGVSVVGAGIDLVTVVSPTLLGGMGAITEDPAFLITADDVSLEGMFVLGGGVGVSFLGAPGAPLQGGSATDLRVSLPDAEEYFDAMCDDWKVGIMARHVEGLVLTGVELSNIESEKGAWGGCPATGIRVEDCTSCTVTGNVISTVSGGDSPCQFTYCCDYSLGHAFGIDVNDCTDCFFIDNEISDIVAGNNSKGHGPVAFGLRLSDCSGCEVTGNTVVSVHSDGASGGQAGTAAGIALIGAEGCQVGGNTVSGVHGAGAGNDWDCSGWAKGSDAWGIALTGAPFNCSVTDNEVSNVSTGGSSGEVGNSDGIYLEVPTACTLSGNTVSQVSGPDGYCDGMRATGIRLSGATDCKVSSSTIQSILAGCGQAGSASGLYLPEGQSTPVVVSNAIISNIDGACLDNHLSNPAGMLVAEYSNLFACAGVQQNATVQPTCIQADPMFVDAAGGDLHLLPTSPCIDTGDPAQLCTNEPAPNGCRVNMGAYGNTPEATSAPGAPHCGVCPEG